MSRHHSFRRAARPLLAAIPLACMGLVAPASAAVVISQVYGGNGNAYAHDYVELFNNGSAAVDVTGWSIQYSSATGTGLFSANGISTLSGSIPAGRYLLVKLGNASAGAAVAADITGSTSTNLSSANGKVVLVNTSTGLACNGSSTVCSSAQLAQIVDLVGYGTANYAEGSAAPALTTSTALFRAAAGCTDTGSNSADFSTGTPAPRNSATAALVCDGSSSGGGGSSGGGTGTTPTSRTIPEIQGSGSTSPFVGQPVVTSGVVTRVTNYGFFMQAQQGDGIEATSDGILVYIGSAPAADVTVGKLVQVSATVSEFSTAGSTVTELTSPTVTVQSSGFSVAPVPITLPVAGGLERYEGMLVSLSGPLTVNQNYFQARYGQLTLSAGGRLETPTNRYRPGTQAQALAAENAARRVVLEDGSSLQNVNPTAFIGSNGVPRGGDTITGPIVGVLDWGPSTTDSAGLGDWRIVPLNNASVAISATHPRPTTVPAVGGNVKLASFNVLNYFTTFKDGKTVNGQTDQTCVINESALSSCRGASNADEFTRQQAKIVAAISAINADALGLMEMQNNGVAAQNLVAALNAQMGAGTYAVAPGAAAGVVGSDAIKTTIIYKPAKLSAVGDSTTDTHAVNSRPTVAQTFAAPNGLRFTLVVNHFKSKGSCPSAGDGDYTGNFDAGDGQGCWNLLRTQQANQLRSFVTKLQTDSGSQDVVIVGDLNAYAKEDPVHALTSNGFVDQIGRFNSFGYSYVFDGAAGRLDHAITSAAASGKVSGATEWHINADESLAQDYNREFKQPACAACAPDPYTATPYRSSDHDPVVMGLNLYTAYLIASGSSYVGTAGDDFIAVPAGRRTLAGGAGRDQFAFAGDFAGGATISDFNPGVDMLNFKSVLQALRVSVPDPWAAGYLGCLKSGTSDAAVTVDPDGTTGAAVARPMVLLKNVTCSAINAASFIN